MAVGEQKTVIVILTGRAIAPDQMHRKSKTMFGQLARETQALRAVDAIRLTINELESVFGKAAVAFLPGGTSASENRRTLVFGFPIEAAFDFKQLYRRSIHWLLEK